MIGTTGLRERKKSETRRVIAAAALGLAIEHGPDAITVEQIADAADVSPRTVFNYFGTKDEAIVGIDPERRAEVVSEVARQLDQLDPLRAIEAVMAASLSGGGSSAQEWLARAELVQQHPHLRAAQQSAQAALEHDLIGVVAAHLHLDPDEDLYPVIAVTTAMTAVRVALHRSAAQAPEVLRAEIRAAVDHLERGLAPPPDRRKSR